MVYGEFTPVVEIALRQSMKQEEATMNLFVGSSLALL
jgi:hypothetical protein